jgi:hypothetical protein
MSNIWSESFNEIREPFFEAEDPYTKAGEKYEGKYKKTGKKSKDYDGDGTVEDEADEYAGVKDNAIKKAKKSEKIDGKPGSVKNKINLNPVTSESFDFNSREHKIAYEAMLNYFMKEEQKLSEASTTPPLGDAQTEYKDPQVAAKQKVAQAQIRKELADAQLQKTKSDSEKSNKNESVVSYLQNRYNF